MHSAMLVSYLILNTLPVRCNINKWNFCKNVWSATVSVEVYTSEWCLIAWRCGVRPKMYSALTENVRILLVTDVVNTKRQNARKYIYNEVEG